MFNVGGGELLMILLVALLVLGPQKLPGAARQVGHFMGELRRMSSGFQAEMRNALDEPVESTPRRPPRTEPASEASAQPAGAQVDTPVEPAVASVPATAGDAGGAPDNGARPQPAANTVTPAAQAKSSAKKKASPKKAPAKRAAAKKTSPKKAPAKRAAAKKAAAKSTKRPPVRSARGPRS